MKTKGVRKYRVIGLMSGTSMDGVDLACCKFEYKKKKWRFWIEAAKTFPYATEWRKKLNSAHLFSGQELIQLHTAYGAFLGELCNQFIKKHNLKNVDLISSHGHTLFHRPKKRFTFQLGDGNAIRATTGLPVAFDFRSLDVALGGEGAPLVPVGDHFLFSKFDVCLNLGGIANLSTDVKGKRRAFDICFCNMALNFLSAQAGKEFDENGKLALKGKINPKLLNSLEKKYSRLSKKRPSLSREGFEKDFLPLIKDKSISLNDRLRTVCESIADEIAQSIPSKKKMLITGGGAHNQFLIQLLKKKLSKIKIIIPDQVIIDFKEAMVFAFLGVLRIRNEINVLKGVTGSSNNSCSGILIK